MTDLFTNWETARRMVMPSVQNPGFIRYVSGELRRLQDDELCYRLIAPELFAVVAIDLPDTMVFVQQSMLDDWGVSFDVVFETALNRLEPASAEPLERLSDQMWQAPWDDGYAAARVLLPDVLRRDDASPYIAIPDRDILMVGSGAWGFADMVVTLKGMMSPAHPITPIIYRLVGDELVPVKPPPTRAGAVYASILH
jgi:uncharacterized protein YtpQ (UPF0354 family)